MDDVVENKSKHVLEDQEFFVSDEGTIYVKEGCDVYRLEFLDGLKCYEGHLEENFEGSGPFTKTKPSALANFSDVGAFGNVCFLDPAKAIQTNAYKRKAVTGLSNSKKAAKQPKQSTTATVAPPPKAAKVIEVIDIVDETEVTDDVTTDESDEDYSDGEGSNDEEEHGDVVASSAEKQAPEDPPAHPVPLQRSKTVSAAATSEVYEIETPKPLTRCDDSSYDDNIHPIELPPPTQAAVAAPALVDV